MTRILVLSDVHGNLAALQEILAWGEAEGCDEIWNLGDTLGIGEDGIACYDLLAEKSSLQVLGNHDWCAINPREIYRLNAAAESLEQELARIEQQGRKDILDGLAEQSYGYQLAMGGQAVILCHATPGSLWEFANGPGEVALSFHYNRQCRFILCGHTHIPYLGIVPATGSITATQARKILDPGVVFDGDSQYLLNPGAVGGLGVGRSAGILTLSSSGAPERFDWKPKTKE